MRYDWRPKPETIRFVLITALAYIVQVAATYKDGDLTDWRKFVIAFAVGFIQYVGTRFLDWYSHAMPPPEGANRVH